MQRYRQEINGGEPWAEPDVAGAWVLHEDAAAAIAEAVALERERCANICEGLHSGGLTGLGGPGDANAQDCADMIRQ